MVYCLRPVLNTPACSLAIVTPYKYLGSVKKEEEEENQVRTDTKGRFFWGGHRYIDFPTCSFI
jgi:hypothetical protein